jgi:acyl-CoA synthetase (AMP-forming)/AMP-acid ligase II
VLDAPAAIANPDIADATATTYRALDGAVQRLAAYLHALVGPGARVGIMGNNSVEFLTVVLAAARAGCIAVPMSPRQGPVALQAVLDDAQPAVVFADLNFRHLMSGDRCPTLTLGGAEFEELTAPPFDEPAGGPATVVELATSGSSGRPKGVLLSHDAVLWPMQGILQRAANPSTIAVVATPIFHMNGLQSCLFVLAQGGTVLLLDRFEPHRYLETIRRHRPTVLVGVPTMFAMLLDAYAEDPTYDLTSVMAVVCASAPLSDEQLHRIKTMFPGAMVQNTYGTTEAFGIFGPHRDGVPAPPNSVGAVQPGVDVRLVDGPCPTEGRLLVRTPASMAGYHNDDQATAAKLRDGWYDTGDLFRVDKNGFYFVVGRSDDMIICGGENIYPAQVESLLESHPAVRLAAVVAIPDDRKGQVPVAFVVPVSGATTSAEELKTYTLEHGPAYARPRHIALVDDVPMTGPDKIDKRELQARAEATLAPRSVG